MTLFEISNLSKHFNSTKALSNISLSIASSKALGIVGESGSGKSTLGRCLLRLETPSSGSILYKGQSLLHFSHKELFAFRREAQIIFQDPYSSLNPRMTAGEIIAEPLHIHRALAPSQIQDHLEALALKVGLSPYLLKRFPHEFSGGQRQRIGIARALALNPSFIVCDEPISALDVPIQAQILNLLKTLQQELGLTYLFITHNLSVVRYLCDQIAVLYQGHLVEMAPADELYKHPLHPYTQELLSAIPHIGAPAPHHKPLSIVRNDAPSKAGCPFASRCPHVQPRCHESAPPLTSLTPSHQVACHLYG